MGATDAPLTPEELEKDGLAQWPMVMGGIATIVDLDGVKPGGTIIDGPTLAEIYLGKITKWNDPAVKAMNPKVNLAASNDGLKFFKWAYEKGGKMAAELDYIPMPDNGRDGRKCGIRTSSRNNSLAGGAGGSPSTPLRL